MTDINNVCLMGRITHDVGEKDFGYIGELAKLTVSIAVNRSKKNGDQWEDEASFFEVQIFGKKAESLHSLISKGKQIALKGSLRQERWENKEGKKQSKVVIIADEFRLIGGKEEASSGSSEQPSFVPDNMKKYQKSQNTQSQQNDFPEDIPF